MVKIYKYGLENIKERLDDLPDELSECHNEDLRVYKEKLFARADKKKTGKNTVEYLITKFVKNSKVLYELDMTINGMYTETVFVLDTPKLSYIAAALNWIEWMQKSPRYLRDTCNAQIKLAGEFMIELLEKHDINCPIQAKIIDLLDDKESLFQDCDWLEKFITEADED